MSKKQELKNYVVNSVVRNAFDPNELLRLINLLPDQPQLNEKQQSLITWMQDNECETDDPLESISDLFLNGMPSEYFPDLPLSCLEAAYQSLNKKQKLELVQEYIKKALEQEEEK
ncbi:hypothetical protein ACFC9R_10145 [Enterococcus casseliflavus]